MKEITIYAPTSKLLDAIIDKIAEKVPSFMAVGTIEEGFLKATIFCDEKDAEYVRLMLASVALFL